MKTKQLYVDFVCKEPWAHYPVKQMNSHFYLAVESGKYHEDGERIYDSIALPKTFSDLKLELQVYLKKRKSSKRVFQAEITEDARREIGTRGKQVLTEIIDAHNKLVTR